MRIETGQGHTRCVVEQVGVRSPSLAAFGMGPVWLEVGDCRAIAAALVTAADEVEAARQDEARHLAINAASDLMARLEELRRKEKA